MSQRHRESINDFSGGYNSRDRATMLRKNESPDMLNIVLGRRGTISPRPGTVLYRNDPVSAPLEVGGQNPPVTSVYEYVKNNGSPYFLAFAGESLKVATAGGWSLLSAGFTQHSLFEFITHPVIDLALFVNGRDGYWQTDITETKEVVPYKTLYEGTVNTAADAVSWVSGDKFGSWAGKIIIINALPYTVLSVTNETSLTLTATAGTQSGVVYSYTTEEGIEIGNSYTLSKPKFIEYHKYRVWLANVEGFPDRVYFNVNDIEGNTLYNYFTQWSWLRAATTKGENVTGIKSFKGVLLVFTPTTIRAITGDNIAEFAMTEVSNTVGCVAQRSIQVVGSSLIFLGVDGVYMFDGASTPFKVSQRVEPTLRDMRSDHWSQACGVAYNNQYLLSIPATHGGGF